VVDTNNRKDNINNSNHKSESTATLNAGCQPKTRGYSPLKNGNSSSPTPHDPPATKSNVSKPKKD
jgi:hypothetical protein